MSRADPRVASARIKPTTGGSHVHRHRTTRSRPRPGDPSASRRRARTRAAVHPRGHDRLGHLGASSACVGVAIGIAAIVIGLQARARLAGAKGTRMATIAVAIASLGVLSVVFFLLVGAPD